MNSGWSAPLRPRPEFTSIAISASVSSTTIAPPPGQPDFALEHFAQLVVDPVRFKDRLAGVVQRDLFGHLAASEPVQGLDDLATGVGVVHDDPLELLGHEIADGALDEVRLGVEQRGGVARIHSLFDLAPVVEQQVEVALEEGRTPPFADGAADQPHAFRQFQRGENFAQPVALLSAFDARGKPDVLAVWHQHEITPGDGDVGGDPRTFGADRGFHDLHEDFHARFEDIRDIRDGQLLLAAQRLLVHLGVGFGLLPFLAFGLDRLLVAGNGFLIVVVIRIAAAEQLVAAGKHFVIVKEGVLFGADVDEGRLQRGFEVDDFAEVDVADLGFVAVALDLVLFEPPVVQERETALEFFAVQDDLLACFVH